MPVASLGAFLREGVDLPGITIQYRKDRKYLPDPIPLKPEHRHSTDEDFPVVCYDFNGTLTSAQKYPIVGSPFPGVGEVLRELDSRGACQHITTSGLYFGKYDIPIFLARQEMLQGFCDQFELPIGQIGGKVPSDIYYEDRMVEVPLKSEKVDWQIIGAQIVQKIEDRFQLGKDGKYHRRPTPPSGTLITDYPEQIESMKPRGFSSVRIDFDFHRTVFASSSSTRESAPKPGAVETLTWFYMQGVTVRLSCAGWSPLTHPMDVSNERLNGLIAQCKKYNVPYDRIVTKDHGDVIVDDKGITHTEWGKDLERLKERAKQDDRAAPGAQWNEWPERDPVKPNQESDLEQTR